MNGKRNGQKEAEGHTAERKTSGGTNSEDQHILLWEFEYHGSLGGNKASDLTEHIEKRLRRIPTQATLH